MSRAFVREDAGGPPALPDLPVSPHPNLVTPSGLAALRSRLAGAQAELAALKARADRTDRHPEAVAERDIRYLEARLRTAVPVDPALSEAGVAGFGSTVTVEDGDGMGRRFRIVGEDEADAARGWVTVHAPLGRALVGARAGDEVEWRRPSGAVTLTVIAVSHED